MWEGRSREAPPYPDCATALRVTAPPSATAQMAGKGIRQIGVILHAKRSLSDER